MDIKEFTGPYAFLSNFSPARVLYEGREYPTLEHAYQAAKTLDPEVRATFSDALTAGQAKRHGREITMRADWDERKLAVMADLLAIKFSDPELRTLLLATGTVRLIEGNRWGDHVWGVCDGWGRNELGKLLMELRAQLRKSQARERSTQSLF